MRKHRKSPGSLAAIRGQDGTITTTLLSTSNYNTAAAKMQQDRPAGRQLSNLVDQALAESEAAFEKAARYERMAALLRRRGYRKLDQLKAYQELIYGGRGQ